MGRGLRQCYEIVAELFQARHLNCGQDHAFLHYQRQGINILEVDEHLTELSSALHGKILPDFEEYGITIPQFYLTTVVLPEDDTNFRRIRELYTLSLQKQMIHAETDIRTTKAQADVEVISAARAAELERQQTQPEIAKREAERKLIEAQAEAMSKKTAGLAEAEIMQAQGFTKKELIQADVQKAFAAGLGNMGGGGSSGGSVMSDIVGLGIGMKAAGMFSAQFGDMFAGADHETTPKVQCAQCGAAVPTGSKFCPECGEKVTGVSSDTVVCPECGKTVQKGKFCPECGHKLAAVCPNCGKEVPGGAKFCLECGTKL